MMKRKRKKNSFSLQWEEEGLSLRINVHKDWLRDHSSRALCGIEMLIKGILKSCFWISLHQGMFSIFYSRIQGYVLYLMNEVDSCLLLPLCVLYEMQNQFLQQGMLYISSCLIFISVCTTVITFVIHRSIIHESIIHAYLSMIIHELFVNENICKTQESSLGDISTISVIKILNQKLFTHSHQSRLNQSCLNTTNMIVIQKYIKHKRWLT